MFLGSGAGQGGCNALVVIHACEQAPAHSVNWASAVVVPVIAAAGILGVALYTAWHTGRREVNARRATSDSESLEKLLTAAGALRASSAEIGKRIRPSPRLVAEFDAARADFHVRCEAMRQASLRTVAKQWETTALKAHSLDPKTPLSAEHAAWDRFLVAAGETAREFYKGKD